MTSQHVLAVHDKSLSKVDIVTVGATLLCLLFHSCFQLT